MADHSICYVSAAANRHHHASHCSPSSLASFGSSNSVALWDAADKHNRGVLQTLSGHPNVITGTRFISDNLLVSTDEGGLLICWARDANAQWNESFKIQAHKSSISALQVFENTLLTGSSDSEVKIWEFGPDSASLTEIQTILLKGKYPLSLSCAKLPQSHATILALGTTSKDIQIWIKSERLFIESTSLPGHEDWIRSLAFGTEKDSSLVLASGSQDSTIRLWSIEPFQKTSPSTSGPAHVPDDLLDAFEASLGELGDSEEGGRQISLKRHLVTVKSNESSTEQFSITFDALLVGHESAVNSLAWQPSPAQSSTPTLLSSSTDSSAILWSPSEIVTSQNETTSLWINRQRFGDVGGQRLGGFIEANWAANGSEILAHGWSGGWRRWRCASADEWSEIGAVSGHNGPVKDIDWSPNGDYLLSVGLDQTSRIHGPVSKAPVPCWHEFARPQVHGYDLVGAAFLSQLSFVSVADEKVARVFEAPKGFVETAMNLGISSFSEEEVLNRPQSATVPPLGLSNKASQNAVSFSTPSDGESTQRRPLEGELSAVTLWPEVDKIFGHGYESVTVAVSNSRKRIATACKSSNTEHAVIRVYHTDKWLAFGQPLPGHALTVTRIAFSPDDSLVLSVSRDRTWRLFELRGEEGYFPVASDKSHARIIWDCCWTVEGDAFATASRDKTVRVWTRATDKWDTSATIKCKEAATAVAFSSTRGGTRRLAIGTEDGEVQLYSSSADPKVEWKLESVIPAGRLHTKHIFRLRWRPGSHGEGEFLASCSEDGMVKVTYFPRR